MQAHLLWYVLTSRGLSFYPATAYLSGLFLLMACQVLCNALKAPGYLQYQLAFLSSVSYPNNSNLRARRLTQRFLLRSSVICTRGHP